MKKNFYKRVHDNFIHEPATSLIGILWYFAAFCGFLVWTSILSGFGVGLMSYTVGVLKLNNHGNS